MSATADYLAYQERYRDVPRESDRVLIELVSRRVRERGRVLDVGCSTGNLLWHLQAARPDLELEGCDVDEEAVDICEMDAGFQSEVWDVTRWEGGKCGGGWFEAVILNAVLYCLDDKQASAALHNIRRVLKPGGHLFVFDLFHLWQQRLEIHESSDRYGQHRITIRPYELVEQLAAEAGFGQVEFQPYLAGLAHAWYATEPDDPCDLTSWTFDSGREGCAVIFRGGLAQPWCHAILTEPADGMARAA